MSMLNTLDTLEKTKFAFIVENKGDEDDDFDEDEEMDIDPDLEEEDDDFGAGDEY